MVSTTHLYPFIVILGMVYDCFNHIEAAFKAAKRSSPGAADHRRAAGGHLPDGWGGAGRAVNAVETRFKKNEPNPWRFSISLGYHIVSPFQYEIFPVEAVGLRLHRFMNWCPC